MVRHIDKALVLEMITTHLGSTVPFPTLHTFKRLFVKDALNPSRIPSLLTMTEEQSKFVPLNDGCTSHNLGLDL